MSVDIRWDAITAGPDGQQLAEKVRAFLHDKFQQIALPRFISAVSVHSFDFGSDCPAIDIKDICDPLPEFYEDDDDDDDDDHDDHDGHVGGEGSQHAAAAAASPTAPAGPLDPLHLHQLQDRILHSQARTETTIPASASPPQHQTQSSAPIALDPARPAPTAAADQLASTVPRSGTPAIPGGTSHLGYFHLPLGAISGTQTPLAAVASGTPFSSNGWHPYAHPSFPPTATPSAAAPSQHDAPPPDHAHLVGSLTRPSTANTLQSPADLASPLSPSSPELLPSALAAAANVADHRPYPPLRLDSAQPADLQVVARVKYAGDVRMTLTAEILLDYPMPSFVGIPLKLAITGITFDGVAILASIKKRMHFCFLSPEDAEALVGAEGSGSEDQPGRPATATATATATGASVPKGLGGLLQEIRVESEIGRKENGKQVLKNVGKVEKFVLEQVRRIFEDEFVFPSFWTFLV